MSYFINIFFSNYYCLLLIENFWNLLYEYEKLCLLVLCKELIFGMLKHFIDVFNVAVVDSKLLLCI